MGTVVTEIPDNKRVLYFQFAGRLVLHCYHLLYLVGRQWK